MDPTLDIDPILRLMAGTNSAETAWLEEIPFNVLKNIESEVSAIDEVVNRSSFLESIMKKELLYRNEVLLIPNEWMDKINSAFSLLNDRWTNLFKQYEKSL